MILNVFMFVDDFPTATATRQGNACGFERPLLLDRGPLHPEIQCTQNTVDGCN
jgi:hypothetical protein